VSSDVDVFYFYTRFKIITHKIRSFIDVLLFSIEAKYVENNKYSQKERIAKSRWCSKLCSNNTNSTCVSSPSSLPVGGGEGV